MEKLIPQLLGLPGLEIEARIKKQIVSEESCTRLLEHFNGWETYQYEERSTISESERTCVYRQRNSSTICKSSLKSEALNDLWCVLHLSTEVEVRRQMSYAKPMQVKRYVTQINNYSIDIAFDKEREWRVEIEVVDWRGLENMKEMIRCVCTVLQGSKNFMGYYDWYVANHVATMKYGNFCIQQERYQKPRTMMFKDLLKIRDKKEQYYVTPKLDGVRRFLLVINKKVFSCDTKKNIAFEGVVDYEDGVHIFDCEYWNNIYWIFDAVVEYGDRYLTPLDTRLTVAENFRYRVNTDYIRVKEHRGFERVDDLQVLYNEWKDCCDIDGLIFVDKEGNYMKPVTKWKEFNTVDLWVDEDGCVLTSDGRKIDIPVPKLSTSTLYEFCYKDGMLIPVRQRPDKIRANSWRIVQDNLFRAVSGNLLSGIGCYLMRKYHNAVKLEMLKTHTKNKVIFDIGTGQGGDISKWENASYVYCIEPSKTATDEMYTRNPSLQNILVINKCLRDVDLEDIKKKINTVTAFFCVNQFQEKDWEMLGNVVQHKGTKKCKILIIAMTRCRQMSNECFSIEDIGPKKYNVSIHDTRIVNINEQIYDVEKRMDKFGFKLLESKRLNEDEFMTPNERTLSAMYTKYTYMR
jgi:hypothetical protein